MLAIGAGRTTVFLYKEIVGPFLATVEVREYPGLHLENPTLNGQGEIGGWCGIMARISDVALGGAGEDWISISYAPTYGHGSFGNKGDLNGWYTDTNRQYFGRNGLRYACGRFLLMNHAGNGKFYLRWSTDGTTWNVLNAPRRTDSRQSRHHGKPDENGQLGKYSASGWYSCCNVWT